MQALPHLQSDVQLLSGVAAGNETALGEIVRRYRSAVERICRAIVGLDSDDCAQEAFTRVWRKADLYDSRQGSPTAWLLAVSRNVAYNLTRRQRIVTVELDVEPSFEDPAPDDRLWVAQALESLPPHQRTVIELAYFHDLSHTQIAAQLGVPLGTVKSWNRRALNRLATLAETTGR